MDTKIRRADAGDADGIARVHVASWQTTYAGVVAAETLAGLSVARRAEMWLGALTRPDNKEFVLVAEMDTGEIFGFASAGPERSGHPDYRGELFTIYLLAEHQRGGLGRKLFLEALAGLESLGIDSMIMWMLKDNPNRGFAERLGGENIASKVYEIGEQRLAAVAYGWKTLKPLLTPSE